MSRRRMVFLVMTALSAISFVVDRFVLSEPASAKAATPSRRKTVSHSTATPAKPADDNVVVDPSLAYLDRLLPADRGRDLFTMTPEMTVYYRTLEEAQREEELALTKGPRPGSREEFVANHHLDGTYTGPKGQSAVISGEVLRVGDEIDLFRLDRIGPYGVELSRGRERVLLRLPREGSVGRGSGSAVRDTRIRQPGAAKPKPVSPR